MSYHEGSNWQAKKEDESKPLYEVAKNALQVEIKSNKEYERYCQELEKFLTTEQIKEAYEKSKL